MLLSSTLLVLIFIANAVQASDETREKRQSVQLSLEYVTLDVTRQTELILNGQRVVRLNGDGAVLMSIDANVIVICDADISPGLMLSDGSVLVDAIIQRCSSVTGALSLSTEPGSYVGPGTLYYDRNSALFIDEDHQQVVDNIEATRPSFALLPIEILFPIRNDDRLVLNIDVTSAPDGIADINDDSIILTESRGFNLRSGDSLSYSGMTITHIRGSQTLLEEAGVDTLETILNTTRGLAVDRIPGSGSGSVNGPGFFYLGESQLGGGSTAFFTNSDSVIRTIQSSIANRLLRCELRNGAPFLAGNFPPNAIISLLYTTDNSFDSPVFIMQNNGKVVVTDRFSQAFPYICKSGIEFFLLTPSNNIEESDRMGTVANVEFQEGGLTVIFNQDTCTLFAYPADFSLVSDLIRNCLVSSVRV